MSKQGRLHAKLSDDNFDFFEAEMKRVGVTQPTPLINMLLSELRELRQELRRTPHISTPTSRK